MSILTLLLTLSLLLAFFPYSYASLVQILTEMSCRDSHIYVYTPTHTGHRPVRTLQHICIFLPSETTGGGRLTGGVQSALYQTSGAHTGKLELRGGNLPVCKLTPTHSCHFHGFGHSPEKALSVRRPFVLPVLLN